MFADDFTAPRSDHASSLFSRELPQLLHTHVEHLRASAISIEVIRERGYRSVLGKAELKNLGFTPAQQRVPGILIPLYGVDGTRIGYQYRPDSPRHNAKGKPIKYENRIGASIRLDVPPRCKPRLGDPSVPIFFVEGVKKADALASHGACVVALNGVWGFKGKNILGGTAILADFDYISLKGRESYIVYDSDYATNPQVRQAEDRLAIHLSRKGSQVKIVHLPPKPNGEKQGVDDFLAAGHTLDQVKALARPIEQQAKEEKEVFATYFQDGRRLYLEVRTLDGNYAFAYLDNEGNVKFVSEVVLGNKVIKPRHLPEVEGKAVVIVGMPNEDIASARLLTPSELYNEILAHFREYIDLPQLDLQLCVYYCLFTWFYPKTNTLGYLRFLADTGKGKSRMQRVVADLCFYPLSASGASSFSGMARQQDKWRGTLVVDECDFQGEKESQITKYFNLGFERGKYYILTDKQNPRRQEFFDPYCPKILAMRTTFRDNALERRLLSVSPHETTNPQIPIILLSDYSARVQKLRNDIAVFVLHHWNDVDGERMFTFEDLALEPGLKQLSMPLSIIFQLWPEGLESFRQYLVARQREVRKLRSQSWEGMLFNLVYAIAQGDCDLEEEFAAYYEPKSQEIQAVTPTMVARQLKTTARAVSEGLMSIGFEVERRMITIHSKDGESDRRRVVRAYVVPDERTWSEMVSRYFYQEGEWEGKIEIPDVLKSRKFVSVEVSKSSKASTEPLVALFVDAVDGFDASAHTEKKKLQFTDVVNDFPILKQRDGDKGKKEDKAKTLTSLTPLARSLVEFWDSVGRPIVHLGPGENCDDLRRLLSNSDVLPRHLEAVTKWASGQGWCYTEEEDDKLPQWL